MLAAGACTSGPDFLRPDKPKAEGYTPEPLASQTASANVAGGAAQQFIQGADIPGQWWTLYRSPQLNALIDEALKANPSLTAAQASLRQARELYFAQQGGLFPQISANGSGSKQVVSNATAGLPGSSPVFGVASVSLNVTYAADIFGGVRRQVESQAAQAEYQRFQLEATYLTLTSNVVTAAVNLASLRAQIAATEDLIRIAANQLEVVRTQFNLGGASRVDVLTQESTLEQVRATLPPLQRQLALQRNQLMTLIGRLPDQDKGEVIDLSSLHLPEELPVSLPSKLVEQRPDVRAAEAQLQAASASIGVAISNQMPQFTITGQYGPTSSGFDEIIYNQFGPAATPLWALGAWSLMLSVMQPLLDGGTLEHRKRAAEAGFDKAAAQYRSAVLQAFQDVANALRALQTDGAAIRAQAAAEKAAAASLNLAQQQYRLGAVAYPILLNAQQAYQTAVINRVKAQAARYSDTAALFQALGGGWWNRNDVDPRSEGKPGYFWLPPVGDVRLPAAGR
jgi:NodT family efflux transporter outer membrane factor (OMF) lipoprotein